MAFKRVRQQSIISGRNPPSLYCTLTLLIAMQVPKSEANKLKINKEGIKLVFADNYQSVRGE